MKVSSGFTIEHILLLLGTQKRTGELTIESGNSIGTMVFFDGNILQAFSPYARAIGDLLVEDGVLGEQELMDVLKLQKNEPNRPVGSLLMTAGKVSFEVVEMMVHEQIRQAINVFRKWPDLVFSFTDKEIKPYDTIQLPVYEFIDGALLKTTSDAVSLMVREKDRSAPKAASAS